MANDKSLVIDCNDELSAYDAISLIWDIPRHRVKSLIVAGCYGFGGSHKTFEQWQEQLKAWDGEYKASTPATATPEKPTHGSVFRRPLREILGLKR